MTEILEKLITQAVDAYDFRPAMPADIEHLVGEIERDVRGGIDEGADTEHPAHIDEQVEAGDPPQRRHR